MANGFLRALAAIKLVEIDEVEEREATPPPPELNQDEIDRVLAAEETRDRAVADGARQRAMSANQTSVDTAAPRDFAMESEIEEGKPFPAYYAESALPDSPYPAEKLLRVLDGLRAMDANTRKAAVLAMDAAEDSWTIADVVLDAQRKLGALNQASEQLGQQLRGITEQARVEKETRDKYLAEATATIQRKIQELETALAREIQDIAAQKAQIDGRVQAAQIAYQRELARIEAERQRLSEIPTTFVIERQR